MRRLRSFLGIFGVVVALSLFSFSALGQGNASLAFCQTTWLVVWTGSHAASGRVCGARVSQSGDVMDTPAILVSTADSYAQPAVASDHRNWLVVWKDYGHDIRAARVTQAGEILDPEGIPISVRENYQDNPAVAFGTSSYLVVWTDWDDDYHNKDIYASRITPSGEVLDPEGIPISTALNAQLTPQVSFDGVNWLVVWADGRNHSYAYYDIYATRVTQSGEVLDPEGFAITTAADAQLDPKVAFGEENYLVVWHGPGGDGARVSPTGVVLDPDGLDLLGLADPAVAFGETDWLAVKRRGIGMYYANYIQGVLIDRSASVQALPENIGVGYPPISVAFGESSWLVAWTTWSYGRPSNIFGACVSQSGEILAPMFKISSFLECAVELREQGTSSQIDEIAVGEFFDIYVQASTVDTNITHVRFSSDDYLDGNRSGSVTDWYDWNTSSEDWNHITKTKAWALATTGGKEVWAEVKDDAGDTSLCYARIDVVVAAEPPTLTAAFSFSPTNPTTTDIVQFTDESTSGDQIVAWSWNFGDGGTSSAQNPTYQYGLPGSYNVTLTVTDAGGATCSTVREVTIQQHENHPPNPPANLAQLLPEGTAIPVGDAVNTDTVLFKGTVSDPDGDTVKLQVELRRLDEYGGSFDDTQGGLKESGLVSSGSKATCTADGLIPANYHWRARAIDKDGSASNWVDFGGNALAEADFTIPPADTTLPTLIQNFTASAGEDRQCTLHWTNPSDTDLAEVIVRRKIGGYPTDHQDGLLRVPYTSPTPGGEGRYADTDVTNDIAYHYAVFSCDASGNWNNDWEEGKNADIGYPTRSLAVPYYNQSPATQWCWATSATMLLKYYGIDIEPWEIPAGLGKGPKKSGFDAPLYSSVHNYLEKHFKGAFQDNWAYDFQISASEIKNSVTTAQAEGYPLYFGVPNHVIVITGCSGSGDNDKVYFHDPSGYLNGHPPLPGYPEPGTIHAELTWKELTDKLYTLPLCPIIFARPHAFSAEAKPLTVSVLPLFEDGGIPFVVSGLKEEMYFTWDGRWQYGYLYNYRWGELKEFPKDPQLGHAAALPSSLSLVASVANSAPYPVTARLQLEIFLVDASGNRISVNPDPIIEDFRIQQWSRRNQNILDAKPLSQLGMLGPGTYILSLSVTDPVSHGLCDTTEILLRVARPTLSGLTVRVVSQDGKAILVFDRVLNGGNTNVVKLDISVDDLGGMVFPHKANPLNPSSRTETNAVNSGLRNANPMGQVFDSIHLLDRGYYVDTTASFTGDITISIHYEDSSLTLSQEKNLKMYKVADTPWWESWGDRIDITQSVDTDLDIITGRTDSFSTFLLGYETGTIPTDKMINHGPNPVPTEGCIFWLALPDDTVAATLKIFDIDGALLVSIPLDGMADRYPGSGRWIPEDDQGRLLGTGLYIYLVEMEHADGTVTYSKAQKMVIQR